MSWIAWPLAGLSLCVGLWALTRIARVMRESRRPRPLDSKEIIDTDGRRVLVTRMSDGSERRLSLTYPDGSRIVD